MPEPGGAGEPAHSAPQFGLAPGECPLVPGKQRRAGTSQRVPGPGREGKGIDQAAGGADVARIAKSVLQPSQLFQKCPGLLPRRRAAAKQLERIAQRLDRDAQPVPRLRRLPPEALAALAHRPQAAVEKGR